MTITYTYQIALADYQALRHAVGWPKIEEKMAEIGLKNSQYIIFAIYNGKTIGMARVIGDGGYYMTVVDVIVLPEYQGKGIGKTMMQKVMEYSQSCVSGKQIANVALFSAKGREPFYEQHGFVARPDENFGAGMMMYVRGVIE